MNVLVTGGSGFLGWALAQKLRGQGHRVTGLDVCPPRWDPPHPDDLMVDINDAAAVDKVFAELRPELLVNCAARIDISKDRATKYLTNIRGVANLLNCVRETGTVKRAIWISSQLVSRVGRIPAFDEDYLPDTTYGDSKVVTEVLVKSLHGGGAEWVIVRPTTVWGPGMSDHYVTLLHYLESRRYFHIGAKPQRKSFSYIDNATFQLEKLLFANAALVHGKTFYIADYVPIDLREWCNALARGIGAARPPTVPLIAAKAAARVGDFLEGTFAPGFKFNSFRLRNIVSPYVFDVTGTESVVGPLPWNFDESVQQTVRWYRDLGGAKRSGR